METEILEMTIASGLFKGTGLDNFYTIFLYIVILLPFVTLLWANIIKTDLKGIFNSFRISAIVALVILIMVVAYRPTVAITNSQNNKTLVVNDPLYAKQIKKAYETKYDTKEAKELDKYVEELNTLK